LKTKVWILDWVVICWWEPTIQKNLIEFCKKIKDLWFLVKLDTNWLNPLVLEKLINANLVDYIAMDIKLDFDNLEDLLWVKFDKNNFLKSIEIIKKSWIDYEFRTTLIKNYHDLSNFEKITKYISWAKKYVLQNYKWWNTLDKNFIWESFIEAEIKEFQNIAKKYIENSQIRI